MGRHFGNASEDARPEQEEGGPGGAAHGRRLAVGAAQPAGAGGILHQVPTANGDESTPPDDFVHNAQPGRVQQFAELLSRKEVVEEQF